MVSADNATYTYNAQGLRTSKKVGQTDNFVLVGGNVWADSDTAYFRGIELISNGTQLYLYNVRGDVIQLLGFDGEVDKTYDYDAYGNELQRNSNDSNPFRYCGEYYDTETGFIYLRARYYDPMVGRFTSVDPIKDGLNWYSYCYNNPVTYIDPLGLRPNNQFTQILKDPGGGKQPIVSTPSRKEVLTVTETTANSSWYENNGFSAADAFKILSNETDKAVLSSIVKHLDDPMKNDAISLPINSNASLTTNNGKISYSNKDTGLSINASTSIRIEHSIDNKTKARTLTITHIKDFKIELGDKNFWSHESINIVTSNEIISQTNVRSVNGKKEKTLTILAENSARIIIYWFYISGKHVPNSKESLDVYW